MSMPWESITNEKGNVNVNQDEEEQSVDAIPGGGAISDDLEEILCLAKTKPCTLQQNSQGWTRCDTTW